MSLEFSFFGLSALEDIASILRYINHSILFYSKLSLKMPPNVQMDILDTLKLLYEQRKKKVRKVSW